METFHIHQPRPNGDYTLCNMNIVLGTNVVSKIEDLPLNQAEVCDVCLKIKQKMNDDAHNGRK